MEDIVKDFCARLEAGEDPGKLRKALADKSAKIAQDAGFQEESGRPGFMKWNMSQLASQTRIACDRGEPTPVVRLRQCEVAAVYLRFPDMDHPNAKAALFAARNGRIYPSGGFSDSAQLECLLMRHSSKVLTQKTAMPYRAVVAAASRASVTAEFQL